MIKKGDKTSNDLLSIPGIGKSLAMDLRDLGIHQVSDLRGTRPRALYDDLCRLRGVKLDPCVLYTFRCAVYYADNDIHDPDLLKWWNWKDISYKQN